MSNPTPTVIVSPHTATPRYYEVTPDWSSAGVDRPISFSVVVTNERLAERLARAIEDGVVYPYKGILTDVNGKTYVEFSHNVMGRYMNSDLTKLGY